MKVKIWFAFLLAAVLLAGCSKNEDISDTASGTSNAAGTSDISSTADISDTSYVDTIINGEIWSVEGYYLRTDNEINMILAEHAAQGRKTYYEPTIIYFDGEGGEGDVPFGSLKTGDKIEADVKLIMESYPAQAPIYGLRFIESGDVSNINSEVLLQLESMGYHAVIGEKTEQPNVTRSSGYFVRTDTDCFLVPSEEYGTLADVDLLKIYPAKEMGAPPNFDMSGVSLDGFDTGDKIWVDIMIVQELYPPISPICGAALIEEGDISDIDGETISKLSELGYSVKE